MKLFKICLTLFFMSASALASTSKDSLDSFEADGPTIEAGSYMFYSEMSYDLVKQLANPQQIKIMCQQLNILKDAVILIVSTNFTLNEDQTFKLEFDNSSLSDVLGKELPAKKTLFATGNWSVDEATGKLTLSNIYNHQNIDMKPSNSILKVEWLNDTFYLTPSNDGVDKHTESAFDGPFYLADQLPQDLDYLYDCFDGYLK